MRKNINIPSALNSWCTLSGFLCLTLVFASCGQSMEERGEGSGTLDESVPLSVEVSLSAEGVQSPGTRAEIIKEDNAKIGVFLSGEGEDYKYTPQCDRKYSYNSTATPAGWYPVDTPITVKTKPANVVAYYDPTGAVAFGKDENGIVNSTVTSSTLLAQDYDKTRKDQLWYYDNTHTKVTNATNVINAKPTINFNMKPAYARLSFQISRNSNYPNPCKVTKIEIKPAAGSTYYTSATVDIAGGVGNKGTLSNPLDIIYTKETSLDISATTPDTSVDLLIPPQPRFGLTLTLTVNGEPLSVAIPIDSFEEQLAPGSHYTVLVQISSAGVSGVTIPDAWGLGDNIDGGTPTIPIP